MRCSGSGDASDHAAARVRRLQATRARAREVQARTRRAYALNQAALASKAVDKLRAEWEHERAQALEALQSEHEQALVTIGSGHKGAASHMNSGAEEAEAQAAAWKQAASDALRRGAAAMAADAATRNKAAATAPRVRMARAKVTYNAWGAVPPEVAEELHRAAVARSSTSRRARHVYPSVPVPVSVATTTDPTAATFSAVKAAQVHEERHAQRSKQAARVRLQERAEARQRGQLAARRACQATDARSIVSELQRLHAADRRMRGMRAPVWEPPPDTREGAMRAARKEAKLERAFETMLAASGPT